MKIDKREKLQKIWPMQQINIMVENVNYCRFFHYIQIKLKKYL